MQYKANTSDKEDLVKSKACGPELSSTSLLRSQSGETCANSSELPDVTNKDVQIGLQYHEG